jgi:predicted permease
MIPFLLGAFIGGFFVILLLAWIFERVGGRRFKTMDREARTVISVGIAWFATGLLGSFGWADGGPLHLAAFFYYIPSALAVWFYRHTKAAIPKSQDTSMFD